MRDAHDPVQNFINALYERDKGRYLPCFDGMRRISLQRTLR